MDSCRGESHGVSPERIVLSGARIDRLAGCLGEELGLSIEPKDSLACLAGRPETPDLASDQFSPVSLTTLIGVALAPDMLGFNLVPDVVRMRKALVTRSRMLALFVILAMAAMISASIFATIKVFLTRHRYDMLARELAVTGSTVAAIEQKQAVIKVVRGRLDTRLSPLNLLYGVHGCVEGDIYFDSVDIDRDNARIAMVGSAAAARDIRVLVNKLEGSALFRDVRETGTMTMDRRTGRYKFEVVCSVEK